MFRGTLTTLPIAVCGTGNLGHIGTFHAFAHVYAAAANAGTVAARFSWQDGDGPFRSNAYALPPVANAWSEVDLGIVTVTEKALGTQKWSGIAEALSTVVGETVDFDYIYLVPAAEGYGEARAAFAYKASTLLLARDEFTGTTAGNALNARVAPLGGTWATSGATTDYVFADVGGESLSRSTTSDGGPRLAVLGSTNYTNIEAGVLFYLTGAVTQFQGLIVRYVDASNYLRLEYIQGAFKVIKRIAGTETTIASGTGGSSTSNNPAMAMRVVIYSSGLGYAYLLSANGGVITYLPFLDSTLATGGTLATGKPGLYDMSPIGTSVRYYDDFYAATPAAAPITCHSSQSIEFRHDQTIREDSTGTYWGPPPAYRGSRFLVPVAGTRGRKVRVALVGRRQDTVTNADENVADNLTGQVNYTPRYVVAPR